MNKVVVAVAVSLIAVIGAVWLAHRSVLRMEVPKHALDRSGGDLHVDVNPAATAQRGTSTPNRAAAGISPNFMAATSPTVTNSEPRAESQKRAASTPTVPDSAAGSTPPKSDAEALLAIVAPTGATNDEFDSIKVMHNRLTTEPKDDEWAKSARRQLWDYVGATIGPQRIAYLDIQCASTLCEMQATMQASTDVDQDTLDWQVAIGQMHKQSWWSTYQFDQGTTLVGMTPDKRALFVAFITRIQTSF